MVSLNGIRSATYDRLFLRNASGTTNEIRDLFSTSGTGITADYVSSVIAPLELQTLLMTNTQNSQGNLLNTVSQRVDTLEQQTATILNDPVTATEVQTLVNPLEHAATAHSQSIVLHDASLQEHEGEIVDLDQRLIALTNTQAATHENVLALIASTGTSENAHNAAIASIQAEISALETSVNNIDGLSQDDVIALLASRDAQIDVNTTGIANNLNAIIANGSDIANISTTQAAVSTELAATNASLANTNATLSTVQTDITNLQAADTSTAAAISALQSDFAIVNNRSATNMNSITSNFDMIANLVPEIEANTSTIATHSNSLTSLTNSLTTLTNDMLTLDAATGDLDVPSAVVSCEKLISAEEVEAGNVGVLGRYLFNAYQSNMCLHHKDLLSSIANQYSLLVNPVGSMKLNAPTGQDIKMCIAGQEYLTLTDSGSVEISTGELTGELQVGPARIGHQSGWNSGNHASFSHKDHSGTTSFALRHYSTGALKLNAAAGQYLSLGVNNGTALTVNSDNNVTIDNTLLVPSEFHAHNCFIGQEHTNPSSDFVIRHVDVDKNHNNAYSIRVQANGRLELNGGTETAPQAVYVSHGADVRIAITSGGNVFYGNSWNTGNLTIYENLTVNGVKNFDIPHPTQEGHRLRHRCIESDRALNVYRQKLQCTRGLNRFPLPSYFQGINEDPMIWVNPYRHRGSGWADVEDDELLVDVTTAGLYNIMLTGVRCDATAKAEFEQYGVEYEASQEAEI